MTVRTSLARLVRRDPDRPTLRERAAALRASASRLLHRRREERVPVYDDARDAPADWSSPPEGFMAYPSLHPECFMALRYALPKEALRLYRLASDEFDRRRNAAPHDPAGLDDLRRRLRVDELHAAAFGQAAVDMAQGPAPSSDDAAPYNALGFVHDDGTVSYRDAAGQLWQRPVAHWIGATLQRLASIAAQETTRQFNVGCRGLDEEGCQELEERLRRELRADELRRLVYGSKRPAEKVDPFYPTDRSDPVFAAYDAHQRVYAEHVGHPEFGEGADGDNARADAEGVAFKALLHTPLTTDAGRLCYALAVIERETGHCATPLDKPERDDPLPVAYRNLRFGEIAAAKEEPAAQNHPAPAAPLPPPTTLAKACDWAVAHIAWLNATSIPENWSNERIDEECDRGSDVIDRAIAEPSASLDDIAAKARLALAQIRDHSLEESGSVVRLAATTLREIVALEARPAAGEAAGR